MSSNSNSIEIKLRFLTERLDSIKDGVKELEGLKKEALSTGTILKTAFTVGGLQASVRQVVDLKRGQSRVLTHFADPLYSPSCRGNFGSNTVGRFTK